jgi:multidrug transporter EmrE-like cation transporter
MLAHRNAPMQFGAARLASMGLIVAGIVGLKLVT